MASEFFDPAARLQSKAGICQYLGGISESTYDLWHRRGIAPGPVPGTTRYDVSAPENPSAFPMLGSVAHNSEWDIDHGMTLRDYFATHAPAPSEDRMQTERGIDRNRNLYNEPHKPKPRDDDEIRATLAYRYADAMLSARGAA